MALGTRRDHRCPSCAADVARCHSWEGEDGMPARMPVAFSAICTPKLIHFQLFPADNRVIPFLFSRPPVGLQKIRTRFVVELQVQGMPQNAWGPGPGL